MSSIPLSLFVLGYYYLGYKIDNNILYGLLYTGIYTKYIGCLGHGPADTASDTRITKIFPFNLLFTCYPSYHALHHARFNENYGAYTRIWDKLFGTESKDYYEVVKRVSEDKPLTSLHERCTVTETQ